MQREERENEKLREQERIRSGKELAAAKKEEESLQLKRNLELRRIEKAEEARAREKIRLKLGESASSYVGASPFSLAGWTADGMKTCSQMTACCIRVHQLLHVVLCGCY